MTRSRLLSDAKAAVSNATGSPYAKVALIAGGALAASALANSLLARRAERDNPPKGRFVEIDGVALHYAEWGAGEPLVLLHGKDSMIEDFLTSGLVEMAAKTYRVIVFDRPGYGHSDRPRTTVWTADAQADLIHAALAQIGISRGLVLGHSWGASVAASMAMRYPDSVTGLVLASGYYYPSVRSDVVMMSGPAVPMFGDLMRYTVSPILGRAFWPLLLRKIFGPSPTPSKFDGFPVEMTLRPSTIRASAAEAALMIPDALAAEGHYERLSMPVSIIAGEKDRVVDPDQQSARLHRELPHSTFDCVPGEGHMIHQTATNSVMAAIERAGGRRPSRLNTSTKLATATAA